MKKLNEPDALREVHEIRLKNYEDTKDMTDAERNKQVHENTKEALARLGIKTIPLPKQEDELNMM